LLRIRSKRFRRCATTKLRNTLTDVDRGVWVNPKTVKPEPEPVPTFHEFSSEWYADHKLAGGRRGRGLSETSSADLWWRLSHHLLPWFADKKLDEITVEDVDRYRLGKVRRAQEIRDAAAKGKPIMQEYTDRRGRKHRRAARALSVTSINKTLATLAAVLDRALERELIARNPATVGGRRRRQPGAATRRSWLDRADHIAALLDGAGELDRRAISRAGQRRALLATLVFAGLRIGEALSLRWRDVDLARQTITVRAAKTDAGVRVVNVLPVLYDELADYRARVDPRADALVFGTSTGARQGATNVRRRILAAAVELANEQLAKTEAESLPSGLTPHSLRRTFASLLFALHETPPYVMAQMGHTTASLTLTLYARHMDRRDGEPERLLALVNGEDWSQLRLRPAVAGGHPIGTRERAIENAGRS
jgi:integrase